MSASGAGLGNILGGTGNYANIGMISLRDRQLYSIVSNGLVLHLDSGHGSSYPGSGSSWNDLSTTSSLYTTSSSPTFEISSNSSFSFNGSSNLYIATENSALNTQTPSVEVWIKTNALSQNGFWFEKGQVNTQYSLFQEGTNIQWRQSIGGSITNLSTLTSAYINTSSWYQVVGTYESGSRKLYINGELVNSDIQTGSIGTNANGTSIGVYGGYNGSRGYYYNGNIAIVRVYNKVLSSQEVSQNFNSNRSRFKI
jgi:hypothetical protein